MIFKFEIPALNRADTFFAVDDYRKIVLRVDLGETKTSLDLSQVASLMEVPSDSPDFRLLTLVPAALRYCRRLKAGDTLPSEAIDGRPSWMPKPQRIVRAVQRIGTAIGSPALPLDRRQPSADALDAALDALVDWVAAYADPRKLGVAAEDIAQVAIDTARVDRMCASIVDLQQDIGAVAKIAAARQNAGRQSAGRSERARTIALGIRDALVWASALAIQLDAIVADPLRAFGNVGDFAERLWPKMAALRAFLLDLEPFSTRMATARARDGGPNDQDLDELQRLLAARQPFDASRFVWWKSDLSAFGGSADAGANRKLLGSAKR